MGIIMLRCYRVDCDTKGCSTGEECAGAGYTKENTKPLFEQQGWTFKDKRAYCWKCSQTAQNKSEENNG